MHTSDVDLTDDAGRLRGQGTTEDDGVGARDGAAERDGRVGVDRVIGEYVPGDLGRAVGVDDRRRRCAGAQRGDGVRAERLTAEDPPADTGDLVGELLGQDTGQRRDREHLLDRAGVDEPSERGSVAALPVVGEDDGRSGDQGAEQFGGAVDEGQRALRQTHLRGPVAARPGETVGQRAVGSDDSAGRARRSGREDHRDGVGRGQIDGGQGGVGDSVTAEVDDADRATGRVDDRTPRGVGQDADRCRGIEHVADPGDGIARVDGEVGRARGDDRPQPGDGVDRALRDETDHVTAADTGVDESCRDRCGRRGEFGVGHRRGADHEGGGRGVVLGGVGEKTVHGAGLDGRRAGRGLRGHTRPV
ncbi:hypothetical protein GCM10007298_07070 [Williamsia phyllosphaerae]|uniref:Uncharacterized protein n=1 Tax=Williamsia phyllosphaerae TaxID=885042 RepID=A0ABQ1U988_9NOCA|nr:hypothetical protein GCM10007298_07070 [Williamsia phyllosphaerae]